MLNFLKKSSYFSAKTYVVCTHKNCLINMVLLSNQNKCLNRWIRKILNFTLSLFVNLNLFQIWGHGPLSVLLVFLPLNFFLNFNY